MREKSRACILYMDLVLTTYLTNLYISLHEHKFDDRPLQLCRYLMTRELINMFYILSYLDIAS